MKTPWTKRIRELNDLCRKAPGIAAGQWVQTPGISALPVELQSQIRERIETFEDFNPDNDPYHEHDFGAFTVDGHKVFFKIEYYDKTLECGSPDPADPRKTTRILTVMLAEEY